MDIQLGSIRGKRQELDASHPTNWPLFRLSVQLMIELFNSTHTAPSSSQTVSA